MKKPGMLWGKLFEDIVPECMQWILTPHPPTTKMAAKRTLQHARPGIGPMDRMQRRGRKVSDQVPDHLPCGSRIADPVPEQVLDQVPDGVEARTGPGPGIGPWGGPMVRHRPESMGVRLTPHEDAPAELVTELFGVDGGGNPWGALPQVVGAGSGRRTS